MIHDAMPTAGGRARETDGNRCETNRRMFAWAYADARGMDTHDIRSVTMEDGRSSAPVGLVVSVHSLRMDTKTQRDGGRIETRCTSRK